MLDLRKLRLLRELAARGTIRAVAEALAYTPSAVSQQLAALEREAGVPLLERAGRRVRLTDAGRRLVAHADGLLARLEEAEADLVRDQEEVIGTVRLAAFQTAALALLPPALRALARDHPGLRVEYLEAMAEQALPALALGELDLVIAEEYEHAQRPRDASLEREPLCRDPLLVVLPEQHPLALRHPAELPLAELAGARWANTAHGTLFGDAVVHACRSLGGFEPDVRHRSSDMRILLSLVASGDAVAILPGIGEPERQPGVALRGIAEGPLERLIFASFRRAGAARPAVAALRGALREAAAAHRYSVVQPLVPR